MSILTQSGGSSSPANDAALVTPSDTVDLPAVPKGVYIATEGALRITMLSGTTLTTPTLHVGWHPLKVTRIFATGTTATGIMVAW